jgi:hypothetical protein
MRDPAKPKSWRDVLPIHPAANLFPPMTRKELVALGNAIADKGMQVPVTLYDDKSDGPPVLLDGRNRLDAMEMIGIPVIDESGRLAVEMRRVEGEPCALAVSLNIHRRHLTAKQRRGLIAELMKADPSKSDREIAGMLKASPTTVGTVRAEMEAAGDVSKLDTRRDSKGRNQPAAKPNKQRKPDIALDRVASALDTNQAVAEVAAHDLRRTALQDAENPRTSARGTKTYHKVDRKVGQLLLLVALHWKEATPEERRRFLDAVGLDALWAAMPPAWRPLLELRIANQRPCAAATGDPTPATGNDMPPCSAEVEQ